MTHGLSYTHHSSITASLSLPGRSDVYGLWPAFWTMGNLGRAGYGGSLESLWPYTYDSCDVGTLANQTLNGTYSRKASPPSPADQSPKYASGAPEIALTSGPSWSPYNGSLSFLDGQRLSACTCTGDPNHPGPVKSDGTYMGRAAPEIDIIEAQVDHSTLKGQVSQSAQWAPFNPAYEWVNNSKTYEIFDSSLTSFNSYAGGPLQQATSGLTYTDQNC
jgi:beta-glucan synthesis-associated protein KRE6